MQETPALYLVGLFISALFAYRADPTAGIILIGLFVLILTALTKKK